MTDRELLELAAKAAGINIARLDPTVSFHGTYINLDRREWDPLTDDGDALRLAAKLNFSIKFFDGMVDIDTGPMHGDIFSEHFEAEQDKMPATRRAIVRAAAAIGQGME